MPRALAPPELTVVPSERITGGLTDATVVGHAPRVGAGHRLILATAEGEVEIAYALGAGLRIPVTVGQRLRVRFYSAREGRPGHALVVAAADGRALAIVTRRDGLPPGVLPSGARVERRAVADRLAYTEVLRLPSQCVARIERYDLALTTDEGTRWIPPGTVRRVTLANTAFDLVAYDASRLVTPSCPDDDDPSHASWALLAVTPAPIAPAAADRPAP